jgi:hypothetical protein
MKFNKLFKFSSRFDPLPIGILCKRIKTLKKEVLHSSSFEGIKLGFNRNSLFIQSTRRTLLDKSELLKICLTSQDNSIQIVSSKISKTYQVCRHYLR